MEYTARCHGPWLHAGMTACLSNTKPNTDKTSHSNTAPARHGITNQPAQKATAHSAQQQSRIQPALLQRTSAAHARSGTLQIDAFRVRRSTSRPFLLVCQKETYSRRSSPRAQHGTLHATKLGQLLVAGWAQHCRCSSLSTYASQVGCQHMVQSIHLLSVAFAIQTFRVMLMTHIERAAYQLIAAWLQPITKACCHCSSMPDTTSLPSITTSTMLQPTTCMPVCSLTTALHPKDLSS